VNDRRLRALLDAPAPGEEEASERAWLMVRRAHAAREPAPATRAMRRAFAGALALAAAAAAAVIAFTPPGDAFRGWVHDKVVGEPNAKPALVRLPSPGRLLVVSRRGPWVVQADGSKRRLGAYVSASWSPRGRFVVATRGPRLVALTPTGAVRWTLSRPAEVVDARWSPYPGYRIAYRVGSSVRVVAGDGTGDRLLARGVDAVAPAWQPRVFVHVLAYAAAGRIHVVDTDLRRTIAVWKLARPGDVHQITWSPDGQLLAVRTVGGVQVYGQIGRVSLLGGTASPAGAVLVHVFKGSFAPVTFAPRGHVLAAASAGRVLLLDPDSGSERRVLGAAGRFAQTAWSPNGRWLLVTWPEADQWLFVRVAGTHRISAVSGIGREFDPGGRGPAAFPTLAGWCCAGP
jgi:hypothetical protein